MRPITFSEADLAALAEQRYQHPDPRVQRKLTVLWLKHHGETHDRIAVLAGVSRSSVQRYLDDYLRGGLEEIRRCRAKGSRSQLDI
jgi:transposase